MNGVPDMGGMQGMGPIAHEPHEPAFHSPWEGRVYALSRVLRARGGKWNIDAFRHGIEVLPPADYLRMSYYERWFAWLVGKLVSTGDVDQSEADTGRVTAGSPKGIPFVTPQKVPAMVGRRGTFTRDVPAIARFKAGQRIRTRNIHPPG